MTSSPPAIERAPPQGPPRDPPLPACTACGYSLAGLGAVACPECGHDLALDRENWYRWDVFLRFTGRTLVARWVVLGMLAGASLALAVWAWRMGFGVIDFIEVPDTFLIVAGTTVMWWLGGRYLAGRGLRARSLRRAWMLAGTLSAGLWTLGAAAVTYAMLYMGRGEMHWAASGSWWWNESKVTLLVVTMLGTGVVGAVGAGLGLWSALRLVRLTPTPVERRALRSAAVVGLGPQLLLVVVLIVLGVAEILDRVAPRWWA